MRIWATDVDGDAPEARSCKDDEVGYPYLDDCGAVQYINTHFTDLANAWASMLSVAEAHVSLSATQYEEAKRELSVVTEELANAAARLERVRANYRAWEKAKGK